MMTVNQAELHFLTLYWAQAIPRREGVCK